MSPERININEAKPEKLFYITANAVVYRKEDGRCLLLKRSEKEKVHPGKWTSVGEKIEHADLNADNPTRIDGKVLVFENVIPEVLERGAKEEAGIDVDPNPVYVDEKIIVRPDGTPVLVLVYGVPYTGGEVKPQDGDFTDFAWANENEIDSYDCIEGVAQEVKTTISLFKGSDR